MQWKRIFSGLGLSSLTALMLILAFHPYNLWFLAFIALIPMKVAELRVLPLRWSGLASATGIGGWLLIFLGGMFSGQNVGQVIQIVVMVIILIQIFTVPGTRRFHIKTRYRWFVMQGVFDWVGFEMVRSFIPPINTHAFLAQTQYTQPWMLQPISVFSVYGLGVLIVLINYVLAQAILWLLDRHWQLAEAPYIHKGMVYRWLVVAALSAFTWLGVSFSILAQQPGELSSIRVGAVQHNFPMPAHQDTLQSQVLRIQALTEQAHLAAELGAELIVMPELGLGFDPQVEYSVELRSLAANTGAYLLIGYGLDDPDGWRNEMVMLTPSGDFLDVYGKNFPTSPGEPRIISAGVYPVYDTSLGKLATVICNDMHWTKPARILARKGAQLIAIPTLEVPGIVNEQVAQSVLRAVENRVAVVKADAAYASAIIDPFGRILALRDGSPQGDAFALVADVPLGSQTTIYTRLGDWMGWICLAGWLFFMVYQAVFPKILK